jgi:hypothetical protein
MLAPRRNAFAVAVLLFAACSDNSTDPTTMPGRGYDVVAEDPTPIVLGADLQGTLVALNSHLAAQGLRVAVRQADMSLAPTAAPNRATTVFANDRTLRINYRFVAGDPRRATVGRIVRQASFAPLAGLPAVANGALTIPMKPSIDASFATWNAVTCSKATVVNNLLPANVFNSQILGLGGFVNDPFASDINTVGSLPGAIFNSVLGPGAANSVLAVTFPFVFIDEDGNPTDIDNDGNDDAAFAEIWYNRAFGWTAVGQAGLIDVETVALHENGHALGLGHFGMVAVNDNGKLMVSPRAAMNAFILGALRSPLGTDNAAFCSNWANW